MASSVGETWFWRWLKRHQLWNRGSGWRSHEADGDGVYLPWIEGFDRNAVTEEEADQASRRLAIEEPRFPEHHVHRLLALVRELRAEQTAMPSAPGSALAALRAEAAASDDADAPIRKAWESIDAATRNAYLDRARASLSHITTVPRHLVNVIARGAWAEEHGLIPRANDGRSIFDHWRSETKPAPVPDAGRLQPIPTAPPALTAEQEAIAIARAADVRRAQLDQLKAFHAVRSRAC